MRFVVPTMLISMLMAGSAAALPVAWQLNDVVLSDGQVLTGGFVYDADLNAYSDISIFSSGSVNYPANEWDTSPAAGPVISTFSAGVAGIGDSVLTLVFTDGGLTNAGGTLGMSTFGGTFGTCANADCSSVQFDSSVVLVSGTVSAVPVPAAAWLFGSALAGLGWTRRRALVA